MLSIFSNLVTKSSNLFRGQKGNVKSLTWRDEGLYFDLSSTDLEINHGEQLIASFFPIEDVKGNQDELGLLVVTNLRLVWICCSKKRINLSIGWRTISLVFEQNLKDPLGLPITSLCVLSKHDSSKYEFVFSKMSSREVLSGQDNWEALAQLKKFRQGNKSLSVGYLTPMYLEDPFQVTYKVWQSYKRTHLFRHCRSNLTNLLDVSSRNQPSIEAHELNCLPGEETIDIYHRIQQSESRAIKYTGTLILTNVRLIWIDGVLIQRNISIPYTRSK